MMRWNKSTFALSILLLLLGIWSAEAAKIVGYDASRPGNGLVTTAATVTTTGSLAVPALTVSGGASTGYIATSQDGSGRLQWKDISIAGSGSYLKLDTSNGPLTGDLTVGVAGGGARILYLNSPSASKYARFSTDSTGNVYAEAIGGGAFTVNAGASNHVTLNSGSGGSVFLNAASTVYFRDLSSNNRVTIDAATGNINNIAGEYRVNGAKVIGSDRGLVCTQLDADNIRVDGNTISSTNTNGNLLLDPSGTGKIGVNKTSPGYLLDLAATATSDIISTDGGINLSYVNNPGAPTLALVNTPGNVDAGQHYYYVTYVTAIGETGLSASANVTTDASNGQVTVTIPVSADYRVTARKIYRTTANSSYWANVKLLATINDNITASYTDNIADSGLTGGNAYFRFNTTNKGVQINTLKGLFLDTNMTIVGRNAGAAMTDGGRAVAIGASAGAAATTAQDFVFIGSSAGGNSNSGGSIAIGYGALFNATGASQVALGYDSGYSCTSGVNNVSVGWCADFYNQTGNGNVTIGYAAGGYGNGSAASKSDNALVGYYSGYKLTAGTNTFLGAYTGYSATSSAGNIFLGNRAGYYETIDGNRLIIDGITRSNQADQRAKAILYGVMDAAVANQSLTVNAATLNVTGAVQTSGVTRIDNAGAATLTQADVDNLRLDGNTLSATNTDGSFTMLPNGSGAIKVTGPFQVTGTGSYLQNSSSGQMFTIIKNSGKSADANYSVGIYSYAGPITWSDGSANQGGLHVQAGWSGSATEIARFTALTTGYADVPVMVIKAAGTVGVNTITPKAAVHAVGDASLTGGLYTGGDASTKGTLRLDKDGNGTFASLSSTGDVNTVSGAYKAGSTTVIDASRNGSFASLASSGDVNTVTGAYKVNSVSVIDNARNGSFVGLTASGSVDSAGGYKVGGTSVIDNSRNAAFTSLALSNDLNSQGDINTNTNVHLAHGDLYLDGDYPNIYLGGAWAYRLHYGGAGIEVQAYDSLGDTWVTKQTLGL